MPFKSEWSHSLVLITVRAQTGTITSKFNLCAVQYHHQMWLYIDSCFNSLSILCMQITVAVVVMFVLQWIRMQCQLWKFRIFAQCSSSIHGYCILFAVDTDSALPIATIRRRGECRREHWLWRGWRIHSGCDYGMHIASSAHRQCWKWWCRLCSVNVSWALGCAWEPRSSFFVCPWSSCLWGGHRPRHRDMIGRPRMKLKCWNIN